MPIILHYDLSRYLLPLRVLRATLTQRPDSHRTSTIGLIQSKSIEQFGKWLYLWLLLIAFTSLQLQTWFVMLDALLYRVEWRPHMRRLN